MIAKITRRVRRALFPPPLPAAARVVRDKDRAGLPTVDPGTARSIEEGMGWLFRAQDLSRTADGGVARAYSLINGWASSYPETTGYIVPTVLDYARLADGPAADEARQRGRRMLDWLVSVQFPEGGFQGGVVDATPAVPVTFNTGQILIGLAAGVREFGAPYVEPMNRAADWLVATQDPDGCWRRHPTPFAMPGEKAYETHVAWGLLEAHRVRPNARYLEAALRNIRWSIARQRPNGWLADCCLNQPAEPLTHTIGYALRGILEGYHDSQDPALLDAARRMADGLLRNLRSDGFLSGRFDEQWRGTVPWVCLTGTCQVSLCWMILHEITGEPRYRDAAFVANAYVRRTVEVDGPPEIRGGVKGSYPVDGGYGRFEYLNWACKFFVDAQVRERAVRVAADRKAVAT